MIKKKVTILTEEKWIYILLGCTKTSANMKLQTKSNHIDWVKMNNNNEQKIWK